MTAPGLYAGSRTLPRVGARRREKPAGPAVAVVPLRQLTVVSVTLIRHPCTRRPGLASICRHVGPCCSGRTQIVAKRVKEAPEPARARKASGKRKRAPVRPVGADSTPEIAKLRRELKELLEQ